MIARAPYPSRPLLLLGARRRAALRDALAGCIESWRSQWSIGGEPLEVVVPYECERGTARPSLAIGLTFASAKHGELGVLHADADILPSLVAAAVPAETASAAHGIARDFLIAMLRSLCLEIAKRAGVEEGAVEPTRSPAPPRERARFLSVALRPGHGKSRVVISLAARTVELLAPPPIAQRASAPLTRRRLAVASERVRMEAVLGSADVSLRELVHLAVGDVLVIDQTLGCGGHLALPYGRVVAQIVLGSAGGRRAISIATQAERRSEHP